MLDAAYLIGAQSGVLHPAAIDQHYDGNSNAAMQAVIDGIRTEFEGKKDVLGEALKHAQKGTLKYTKDFTGRWAYAKDIVERIAREAKETT